jgi:GAF domain-containing protein
VVDPSFPDDPEDPEGPLPVLAELGLIVLGDEPLGTVLERVAALAVQAVPNISDASVTLLENERARTVASTGQTASRLDERQYESGWGPCLDAAVSGHRILVDTREPAITPYPDFAATALRVGVLHSISVGLPLTTRVVGALNLYSRAEETDPAAPDLAERFASYAAVAVANAALYSSTVERAENLVAAMQSRATIEQAKGIVMARRHCDADAAFAALVKASQHRNMKLRDVAAAVVASAGEGWADTALSG